MISLSPMRIVAPGPERDRYLPLFYVADDSATEIQDCYQLGDLYALDDAAGKPVAIVLAIAVDDEGMELKIVAVAPEWQSQGIGRQLLADVLKDLRQRGMRGVVVGTSTSNLAIGFAVRHKIQTLFSGLQLRPYDAGVSEVGSRPICVKSGAIPCYGVCNSPMARSWRRRTTHLALPLSSPTPVSAILTTQISF